MGEYLMRQFVEEAGLAERFTVSSAGVRALVGNAAAPGAEAAALSHGVSLEGHEARRLTADMALSADFLIAMDEVVEEEILILTRDRVAVDMWPVDDPYGGPEQGYEVAFQEIRKRVVDWISGHNLTPSSGAARKSK